MFIFKNEADVYEPNHECMSILGVNSKFQFQHSTSYYSHFLGKQLPTTPQNKAEIVHEKRFHLIIINATLTLTLTVIPTTCWTVGIVVSISIPPSVRNAQGLKRFSQLDRTSQTHDLVAIYHNRQHQSRTHWTRELTSTHI